jgi:hypothetical protein
MRHPERITAIVSQNGNAYEYGLSAGWNPIQKYWADPSPENRAALKAFLAPESTKWQYTHGTDESRVAPESYALDSALLGRPGNEDLQLDLFLDYASNVKLYPQFQKYFRYRPPTLPSGANRSVLSSPEPAPSGTIRAQVEFFDAPGISPSKPIVRNREKIVAL